MEHYKLSRLLNDSTVSKLSTRINSPGKLMSQGRLEDISKDTY